MQPRGLNSEPSSTSRRTLRFKITDAISGHPLLLLFSKTIESDWIGLWKLKLSVEPAKGGTTSPFYQPFIFQQSRRQMFSATYLPPPWLQFAKKIVKILMPSAPAPIPCRFGCSALPLKSSRTAIQATFVSKNHENKNALLKGNLSVYKNTTKFYPKLSKEQDGREVKNPKDLMDSLFTDSPK